MLHAGCYSLWCEPSPAALLPAHSCFLTHLWLMLPTHLWLMLPSHLWLMLSTHLWLMLPTDSRGASLEAAATPPQGQGPAASPGVMEDEVEDGSLKAKSGVCGGGGADSVPLRGGRVRRPGTSNQAASSKG